ncbi:MAG TPA: IS256 family transposase [Candidatus Acidoferrales bacterium]|jgi:transposase-like protein|nr:IS256 family transposase [Candidatus Acidoferrales bacterium]
MSTDLKKRVPPKADSPNGKTELDKVLESGIGDVSLRELLGMLISSVGLGERQAYLRRESSDKANGFYDRNLQLGTIPVDIQVPRTRSGQFRPASLPPAYQRGYNDETQALLLGLLASGRSVNAVKEALGKMGLSSAKDDLEAIATNLIEELELHNSRPLDPDLLAVFVDGKYVELRDGDKLRPACIYLVVGLGRDGKKRVLSCVAKHGRENLEDWKAVLRGLIERGLRRVMMVIQDDFSGLLPISQGLFPQSDVQLCVVHMQRNAKSHLSKSDAMEFQQRWRAIKASWDVEVGNRQFEELCDRFTKSYPSFIAELRKKREHYLAFLKYPEGIRRSLSTTNVVEAVNGQLEIMRRNSGGYFHSEDTLKFKLGLAISSLQEGRWRSGARTIMSALHQFNAMFQSRFEGGQ